MWTETPAERQKRIEDEVAGKKRRAVDAVNESDEVEAKVKRRRDDEVRRVVEEHTVRPFFPFLQNPRSHCVLCVYS